MGTLRAHSVRLQADRSSPAEAGHCVRAAFFLMMLAATAHDAVADVRWHPSVAEAATMAQPANRPIMIDFVADWCAACKVMEKDVYETSDFERAAEPFVLV